MAIAVTYFKFGKNFESGDCVGLTEILVYLFCIGVSWWALQAVNFEKFLRPNRVMQAQLLYILVSVALGSTVANFLMVYFRLGQNLL